MEKRRSPVEAAHARIHSAAHARRVRTMDVIEDRVFYPQMLRIQRLFDDFEYRRWQRLSKLPPVNERMEELDMKEHRR